MNKILNLTLAAAALFGGTAPSNLYAQEQTCQVSGVILNDQKEPIADAVVICPGHGLVRTDAEGRFSFSNVAKWTVVKVQAAGFYTKEFHVVGDTDLLDVYLIDANKREYNQTLVNGMADNAELSVHPLGRQNIARKDLPQGVISLDRALQGKITGLQLTQKSGMTGEGSNMSWRGVRSLVAETHPLVVINGVPYLPDTKESQLINGYSRSIFQCINPQDIANVTLLTGAETAAWGSLGSNGVLLIETDAAKSDNLNTRVTFAGNVGVNWHNNSLPLMNASQYKSYLNDIALSYYKNDLSAFFTDFGFMSGTQTTDAHLYAFDTDWQNEIYQQSLTQDYLFRVEGGDAVAKYNISLGYTGDEGVLKNTKSDRFHAQINANVLISKKVEMNANVNLSYLNGHYQEQGYSMETNPLLAAYRRNPLISPYQSSTIPSADGTYALLNTYSSSYFGANQKDAFQVSNPLSLVNNVQSAIRQYDMNSRVQLVYKPMTDLYVAATMGLYVNYDKEKLFVPGIENHDIVPRFDSYGQINNSVQVGEGNVYNFYYGVNGGYQHSWDRVHKVDALAGFQILKSRTEYDMATGRNTANDFYQTMGDTQSLGKYFDGYNNQWNWLNGYLQAHYTYGNLARAGVVLAVDGASSVGADATRLAVYPGVNAAAMLANYDFMESQRTWLDKLDLFVDYSISGNSRYSSKYGQYYYTSQPYQSIAGIVRANVPNTQLVPERDLNLQAGFDIEAMHHRYGMRFTFFNTSAQDVLMLGKTSSALGTSPYYCNEAEISSRGFEVAINAVPFKNKDWQWSLSLNVSHAKNQLESLGNLHHTMVTLADGGEIISRVGDEPYAFYGYQTQGVFSTTTEAKAAKIVNRNGVAYQAGDIRYVDQNKDGIINDADKVVLGSATPDLYGSLITSVEYKGFALDLNFGYSLGNDAYNAVRRLTESSSDFSNQSRSVSRRWTREGDITDMPRANYGDIIGNNEMSDRFIEDASYIKLRDITLSYTWNKKLWRVIQSGTIYVSGQNLLCLTDYLGCDPEFAYSNTASMMGVDFGKVALPKSVKVGVNLKF